MERRRTETVARDGVLPDPVLLHDLLADVRFAPLWLAPRVVFGWVLLVSGWSELQGLAQSGAGLGHLAAIGLTLSGIALILGLLTGPAAFAGGCLSAAYLAGGDVPLAALRFATVVWLVMAWKTAGWLGLDRWLLPLLGLPWRGGVLFIGRTRIERDGERWRK